MNSIAELRNLQKEIARVCRKHGVRKLSVFGSASRHGLRDESDFDLIVEFEPGAEIGLIEFGQLQRELETVVGRQVDLVPAKGLKPFVKETVLQDLELVYAA